MPNRQGLDCPRDDAAGALAVSLTGSLSLSRSRSDGRSLYRTASLSYGGREASGLSRSGYGLLSGYLDSSSVGLLSLLEASTAVGCGGTSLQASLLSLGGSSLIGSRSLGKDSRGLGG